MPSIRWFAAGLFVLLLPAGLAPASPPSTRVAGANVVDAYRAPWWGAEGSQYDRPIHHVLRINNGRFELHHGIVPGRPLADYRLPYWPIRSFVSVVSGDAELPHVPQVQYALEDKRHTQNLVVQTGFELATDRDADILRITNRGNDDRVLLEHLFVARKGHLVILPLGNAEQLVEQVVCARRLGMEVFAQGRGAYHKQPPTFEPLWEVSPAPEQMPDSFAQDEDHYFRVITAARRGGADVACGFNFAIAGEKPDHAWQWKSVLLAAWANFPTPELDAVALLEEPAQLVEALAGRTVLIDNRVLTAGDAKKLVKRLDALVPHGVRLGTQPPDDDAQQTLVVRIGSPELVDHGDWPFRFDTDHPAREKGVIQMSGSVVSCCGRNAESIQKALALLARFAELAQAEAGQ